MNPRFILWPPRTNLGDDHQAIRVGIKRLLNDLIGHMRTVKIAGIDVVDPRLNSLSQNRHSSLKITRRSPHLRAGKLHGAITQSLQAHGSAGEGEATTKF